MYACINCSRVHALRNSLVLYFPRNRKRKLHIFFCRLLLGSLLLLVRTVVVELERVHEAALGSAREVGEAAAGAHGGSLNAAGAAIRAPLLVQAAALEGDLVDLPAVAD